MDEAQVIAGLKRRRTILEYITSYSFITPALIVLGVFSIWPTFYVFYLSLFEFVYIPGEVLL